MNSSRKVVLITAITLSAVGLDYYLTRPSKPELSIVSCCNGDDCNAPCGGSGSGGVTTVGPSTCDAGYELVFKLSDFSSMAQPMCARDMKQPHDP